MTRPPAAPVGPEGHANHPASGAAAGERAGAVPPRRRWLYGAAAISAITNLRDGSYQITPELTYTGFKNTEIRTRMVFLEGKSRSEFGEKTLSKRLEIYAKFFF